MAWRRIPRAGSRHFSLRSLSPGRVAPPDKVAPYRKWRALARGHARARPRGAPAKRAGARLPLKARALYVTVLRTPASGDPGFKLRRGPAGRLRRARKGPSRGLHHHHDREQTARRPHAAPSRAGRRPRPPPRPARRVLRPSPARGVTAEPQLTPSRGAAARAARATPPARRRCGASAAREQARCGRGPAARRQTRRAVDHRRGGASDNR